LSTDRGDVQPVEYNLQYIEFGGMIYGYVIGILSPIPRTGIQAIFFQIYLATKVGFYMCL
jgi:hypothetical protein